MSNQPTFALPSRDELAAIVDQAVDAVDRGALQRDFATVHLRRVLRAEDRGSYARAARIGRQRRAGIAVGRHRQMRDAEAPSPSRPP